MSCWVLRPKQGEGNRRDLYWSWDNGEYVTKLKEDLRSSFTERLQGCLNAHRDANPRISVANTRRNRGNSYLTTIHVKSSIITTNSLVIFLSNWGKPEKEPTNGLKPLTTSLNTSALLSELSRLPFPRLLLRDIHPFLCWSLLSAEYHCFE